MTQQPQHGNASIGNVPSIPVYPPDATIDQTIKTEHPDDRKARIEKEALDAASERRKGEIRFYVFTGIYVLTFLTSASVSMFGPDAATKQGAFTILSAIIGAIGGFALGTKKEK